MSRRSYSIDLIKQMAECDANYIRLLKLVPQLRAYRDGDFDSVFEDFPESFPSMTPASTSDDDPQKMLEGINQSYCITDSDEGLGKLTVKITVVEAFKYTCTLEIVQLPEFKQWMTNPSMLVRVYHDANTAEVVSYQGHKNLQARYEQPNPQMYQPDEKRQVNRFLGEWLTHCLNVGRSAKAPDLLFNG